MALRWRAVADSQNTPAPLWIFGYGSLVWRPAFAYAERRPAYLQGYARRFWQGSTDHRGVPGRPGRVATLIRESGTRCFGMAYRVAVEDARAVLSNLDHRERGGFARHLLPTHLVDGADSGAPERVEALVYWATPDNPEYLGPASIDAIARQVLGCVGPSGPNVEYVTELAAALREMGAHDDHVFAVESRLGTGAARISSGDHR